VAYKRSWREIFVENFGFFTKKEKRSKKERKGGLWKLPQPWKSEKVAFGDFFLMIFHGCLEKPAQKTLRLFHSYHRPGGD
jgi:hypothetical protein